MLWLKVGIGFSLLTVLIGAFGSHGLKQILIRNDTSDIFQIAVRYQMFHSIGIIICGILLVMDTITNQISPILFSIGTLVFSGSLYLLAITGFKWLGAITPIGGVLFIAGWVTLLVALR